MSLLLLEGFDDGLFKSRLTGGADGNTETGGRTGGYRLQIYTTGGYQPYYTFPAADRHATFIVGSAFSYVRGNWSYLQLYGDDYSTLHVYVDVTNTGAIRCRRGDGTVLVSSDPNVMDITSGLGASWQYVELKVLLSDTVGTVDIHVDGTSVASATGLDTKNGGTATVFDTFKYGSSDSRADDLYVCNGAGTLNNDFLGDCRVYTLFPNGNGNYSQLTGSDGNSTDNYLLVDENPTPSSTDYVGDSTAGNKDTYAFDDLTPTVGTILGVATGLYAAKADVGTKHARPVIRRSSTDVTGADVALSTNYDLYDEIFEEDPVASAAWTISTVNASEFGFEVRN